MREDRPSTTAALVAAARALYTELPEPLRLAADPYAAPLVGAVLSAPTWAVRHAPWAALALHHGFGAATLGLSYHVELRTRAIDDALLRAVKDGADRLVILGAGLDSRAYRLGGLGAVDVIEVDHPAMQRRKRARIEGAHRIAAQSLTFVPVDFERDTLPQAFARSGLSQARRTFWIWEGVTVYLTPEAISATLTAASELSAPGSRLAMTYSPPWGTRIRDMLLRTGGALLSRMGEPIQGLMSPASCARALDEVGFSLLSDESALDWAPRYWAQRPLGLRPWERLAIAERR